MHVSVTFPTATRLMCRLSPPLPPPTHLQNNTRSFISKLLFSQLSIPTVLGNPSLPLIIVEDDVVFDPHSGTRLDEVCVCVCVSVCVAVCVSCH